MPDNALYNTVMSANTKATFKKYAMYIIGGIFSLITISSSMHYVDSGESVRFQNNFTGAHEWTLTEGYKLKAPFFSEVDTYNSITTIAITDDRKLIETASATRPPLLVGFADNYSGIMEVSFRAKLSTNSIQLEAMHQDVK